MLQGIATIAAGSVIGHGISHMLFDKDHPEAAPAPAGAAAPVAAAAAPGYSQPMSDQQQEQDPCRWEATDFKQCLTRYNDDISSCQQFFDSLQACRRRMFCLLHILLHAEF